MTRTYEPIASQTLGSNAATASFSSITGTYTDLILVAQLNGASGAAGLRLRINDDTGSNYSTTFLHGNGSTAGSNRESSQTRMSTAWIVSTTTGEATIIRFQFMSYANTNVFKTVLLENARSGSGVERNVGLWRSTSAITKITVAVGGAFPSDDLAAGSTLSLYGVKAA
jgi:hypothetical protein